MIYALALEETHLCYNYMTTINTKKNNYAKLIYTWNSLPYNIRSITCYAESKITLKTHYFKKAFDL